MMQWLKPKYKTKAAHPEPVGEPKIITLISKYVAPSPSSWSPWITPPSWLLWIFLSTDYIWMTRLHIRV